MVFSAVTGNRGEIPPSTSRLGRRLDRLRAMRLFLLVFLVACAPPPYDPPDTASGEADPGTYIDITWPPNEFQATGCVTVVVDWAGITLTDPMVSPDPVDGQGHYHIAHAAGYALCTRPYCLVGFAGTDGLVGTEDDLGEGFQELRAELVDNAHAPIEDENGAIVDTVQVNVTQGECTEGSPVAY